MQDEHGVAVFLEKWWIPLFYGKLGLSYYVAVTLTVILLVSLVTVAGVVVLIDLLVSDIASWRSAFSKLIGDRHRAARS
jgi:hypothetical protein